MKSHPKKPILPYITIPVAVTLTAVIGNYCTNIGLATWYTTLQLPSFTPPGIVIGLAWMTIYILTTIAIFLIWERKINLHQAKMFTVLFLLNGFLNAYWSYLFFVRHNILGSLYEMIILEASVVILIILAARIQKTAAILLVPYAAWVVFATYSTYQILILNR